MNARLSCRTSLEMLGRIKPAQLGNTILAGNSSDSRFSPQICKNLKAVDYFFLLVSRLRPFFNCRIVYKLTTADYRTGTYKRVIAKMGFRLGAQVSGLVRHERHVSHLRALVNSKAAAEYCTVCLV